MFMFEILQLLIKGNLNGYVTLIILIANFMVFCCYWDGIVRNFLYFFCRQLTDFFCRRSLASYKKNLRQATFAALISISGQT